MSLNGKWFLSGLVFLAACFPKEEAIVPKPRVNKSVAIDAGEAKNGVAFYSLENSELLAETSPEAWDIYADDKGFKLNFLRSTRVAEFSEAWENVTDTIGLKFHYLTTDFEGIQWQLKEKTGKTTPDTIIACVGGGSNAAGAFYHFMDDENVELIAVEAAGLGVHSGESAATSQLGEVGIIHGSKTILMQDEYGQIKEPYSISAGLDYPGVGPLHAFLYESKRATFMNATDREALDAAYELTKLEGIIPALETAHALAVLPKLTFKKDQVVVVNLSGRGDKDLETFIKHLE
jgi:hypothetical protein